MYIPWISERSWLREIRAYSPGSSGSLGMGFAVTFVLTLASLVCGIIYHFLLVPFGLEYLKTIAFILIVAALVQFVEMFLKKFVKSLYDALGIYLPLITTNCAVLGVALLNVQKDYDILTGTVYGFFTAIGFLISIAILSKCLREVAERPVDVSRVRIDVPCTSAPRGIPAPDTHGVSKRCSKHAKGHVLPSRNT